MERVVITGGTCLVRGTFIKADILIEDGIIKDITKMISKVLKEDAEVLNAERCLVVPAFFNAHTHVAMTLLRCAVEDVPLMDWLREVWRAESRMNEKDVYTGAMLGIAEMIKSGIACFSDQYLHMDGVAKAVEESGIRAVLGYGMIDMDDEEKRKKELKETVRFVEKWKNKQRITLTVDPHSPYTCSEELLVESIKLSQKYNLPLHIHVAETKDEVRMVKERTGKTPVKYLNDLGFFSQKVIAAHCVWVDDEELTILAKNGVSVAHCPVSNMKLGSGIARIAEMVDAGVNVCLGTDGAASNNSLSIIGEMKFAALLQKLRNVKIVRAEEVFKMATKNGYMAYGLRGGELEEGYLADITILRKGLSYTPLYNPFYSIVYSSYGFEVRDLIVDGKVLMKNCDLMTVDEERLMDEAERRGFDLIL
ncbi:MAG: N-ethylammeline chlorohydrolase [Archaeoglobus sp.]|nr:MAG: N-ethylammeline chlorohydrolase [Archaeoglobus sp.]